METSYLILPKNRHIVPLRGLSPDEIKESARNVIRNSGEKIKHSTILNALAKFLGSTGGYQGYRKHYESLCSFMNHHKLKHHEDLVKTRKYISYYVDLTHQKISERLFLSGKPIPKLLFTGFDFDWVKYDEIQYSELPQWHITDNHHAFSLETCANLLGDDLISPEQGNGYIPKLYFTKEVSQNDRLKGIQKEQQLFYEFRTRFMNASDKGWIEIIPFNHNLIFLKSPDGTYDFVFRNQRDNLPKPPFEYLAWQDTPSYLGSNFLVEDYFRVNVWREQEDHEAEQFFYDCGGTAATYPGFLDIKRIYLRSKGFKDNNILTPRISQSQLPNFLKVTVNGKNLYVSNLISIREFKKFLNTSGYTERRHKRNENWGEIIEDRSELPALATWYDANAYCSWYQKKWNRSVRLLTVKEYKNIYPTEFKREIKDFESPDPVHSHITRIDFSSLNYPPLLIEYSEKKNNKDFLKLRWAEHIDWRSTKSGIKFLIHPTFGEWLADHTQSRSAAISTLTLDPLHGIDTFDKNSYLCGWGCGSYVGCQIGFRICYSEED